MNFPVLLARGFGWQRTSCSKRKLDERTLSPKEVYLKQQNPWDVHSKPAMQTSHARHERHGEPISQDYDSVLSDTQYTYVLQSTAYYCKVLIPTTKYYPVLLTITKHYYIRKSVSTYYNVVQVLQSITMYYAALLRTTKYYKVQSRTVRQRASQPVCGRPVNAVLANWRCCQFWPAGNKVRCCQTLKTKTFIGSWAHFALRKKLSTFRKSGGK